MADDFNNSTNVLINEAKTLNNETEVVNNKIALPVSDLRHRKGN